MDKFVRSPPSSLNRMVLVVGGGVDEYHICLRFFGDDLNPEDISALLGVEPTTSCRKGDLFRGKVSERVEGTGKWLLRLPEKPGESFEPQIDALLDGLTQNLTIWRELTQKYNADLFCGVWLRHWNRGMALPPGLMARLAERGLELGLDIYADHEGNEGEPSLPRGTR